ncbi:CDP-glycerol glycerophosphotransferase family protein [Bacillus sp. SD088]|uniref:CDP-glycerol glycerophosphotransferase family protein n=1 Tax=Bacillus sp. SD088 TaxID=2782012 RepID=UPI001A95C364|nr:CDP-glycerol glycerophosphotransferase family protein [Bacillus sp. SD088]MBO0995709.1 CDP-glycerol glycerophosphotransferase family protein [Bacillus sp. SD088]
MDVYLRNYWLLNLEFIDAFSALTYKNIPLPLLSNFYHYLAPTLQTEMQSEDFCQHSSQDFKEGEIQPGFEKWLGALRKSPHTQPKQGKLLMNFDYLRFTEENYRAFSPETTLLLTRWRMRGLYTIPIISMLDHIKTSPQIAQSFTRKVKAIFQAHHQHPAFSNPVFQKGFLKDIPQMIEKIDMVYSVLKSNPIEAILVGTTEELTSRILAIIGQTLGIPSFCLQHGLILGEEAYLPAFASHYVVYGNYEREWYQNKGVPDNQIAIAGHPRYDAIFTTKHLNRQQVLKDLNLNANKKTIFMATQPNSSSLFVEIAKIVEKLPDIQIIIKPHPWEKAKNRTHPYQALAEKYKQIQYVTSEVPLYSLISASDLVVVANSTVGLEAMLLDRPVVIFKSPTANRDYPYYDSLGDLVKTTTKEVHEIIAALLTSPTHQKNAKQIRNQFIHNNYPIQASMSTLQNFIKKCVKEV